jgi:hypothetical protein
VVDPKSRPTPAVATEGGAVSDHEEEELSSEEEDEFLEMFERAHRKALCEFALIVLLPMILVFTLILIFRR